MLDPRRLERAADVPSARFGLDALYLFGSEARGAATEGSDVDLAALFARRVAPAERLAAVGDLCALLGRGPRGVSGRGGARPHPSGRAGLRRQAREGVPGVFSTM